MLLEAATQNGEGDPQRIPTGRLATQYIGFYAWGTFDGATVSFEVSPHDTEDLWFPVVDTAGNSVALTAAGYVIVPVRGARIRAKVSDAGGDTSLNALMM